MRKNRILLYIIVPAVFIGILFLWSIITGPPQPHMQVGDRVYFGSYRWMVLDIENNYALIITEDIIVIQETSNIMDYLNNEFLQNFSENKRSLIRKTNNNYIFLQDNDGEVRPMLWLNIGGFNGTQ